MQNNRFFLMGALSTLACFSFAACDSDVRYQGTGQSGSTSSSASSSGMGMGGMGGGDGGGGVGGVGGGGGTGGFPPDLPACTGSSTVMLAIDKLFLGDTNPNGTPNPASGWKQYGTNIDGFVSDKTATNLCKPAAGGSVSQVYPDGNNGIDNSFGKNILPIMLGLSSDLSTVINEEISLGHFTYLLSISNVGDEPPCNTSSTMFLGGDLGKTPLFDGTDLWPIDPASLLMPPDPDSAETKFPATVVAPGVVMVQPPYSHLDLHLVVSGFPMVLPIEQARVVMDLSPDHQNATNGHISGIIPREAMTAEIAKIAAAFDTSFCDPNSPTLKSILTQLRQAADIMADGKQDPTKECDGISIGIGFTAKPVKIGAVGPAVPPPGNPCL